MKSEPRSIKNGADSARQESVKCGPKSGHIVSNSGHSVPKSLRSKVDDALEAAMGEPSVERIPEKFAGSGGAGLKRLIAEAVVEALTDERVVAMIACLGSDSAKIPGRFSEICRRRIAEAREALAIIQEN